MIDQIKQNDSKQTGEKTDQLIEEAFGSVGSRLDKFGVPDKLSKSVDTFCDTQGNELNLDNFKEDSIVLRQRKLAGGGRLWEVYANPEQARSGNPAVKVSFEYKENGDTVSETKNLYGDNTEKPLVTTITDHNKVTGQRSFKIKAQGQEQEVKISKDGVPISIELKTEANGTKPSHNVSILLKEGNLVGVSIDGKKINDPQVAQGFIDAAKRTVEQIKREFKLKSDDNTKEKIAKKSTEQDKIRASLRNAFLNENQKPEQEKAKVKEILKKFDPVRLETLAKEELEQLKKSVPEVNEYEELNPSLIDKLKYPVLTALAAYGGYRILKGAAGFVLKNGKSETETIKDKVPPLSRSNPEEVKNVNREMADILKPVSEEAKKGGDLSTKAMTELQNKAIDKLIPEAKKIARKLGLPEDIIDRKLFDFEHRVNPQTGEAAAEGSYSSHRNKVILDPTRAEFVQTTEHELGHMQRALRRAALRQADPKAFDAIVLDKALSGLGNGSQRRYNERMDTRPKYENAEATKSMKDLITKYVGEKQGTSETWYGKTKIREWLAQNGVPEELIKELGSPAEVAKEMKAELMNYLHAKSDTTTNTNALDPKAKEYVDKQAEAFKKWKESGKDLRDNPEVKKLVKGLVHDAHGINNRNQYEFSVEESRSRRLGYSRELERLIQEQKAATTPDSEIDSKIESARNGIIVENRKESISSLIEQIEEKGDPKGELFEKAKTQSRELLKLLPKHRESSNRAVRFMLEKGLLSNAEVRDTPFFTEAFLHGDKNSLDKQSDKKGTEKNQKPGELASKPDKTISDKVKPLTDPLSRPEKKLSLERLESTKEAILKSPDFRKDKGQARVYDLLANSETGILAKLKASGQVPPGWEIYPTEAGSPADKVGADYLLVNKKTGEFHMLDATQRSEKGNVFNLRRDGVIVYDNRHFDLSGALIGSDGAPESELERGAQEFKSSLEKQIVELTKKNSPFKLGETPMPDVRKSTPEGTRAQIDTIVDWARDQAKTAGEKRGGNFTDMANVIEKGAATFEAISQAEKQSPVLKTKAQDLAQREIARYALAKAKRKPFEGKNGSAKPNSDVYYHEKSNNLKMKGSGGERLDGGNMPEIMSKAYSELMNHGKLLSSLSNGDLKELGIDPKDFKNLSRDGRVKAFEEAYKNRTHPQHAKVKYAGDILMRALLSARAEIETGGAIGKGRPVIIDSVVNGLRAKEEAPLLNKAESKPQTKAPKVKPGEVFAKEVPRASEYLRGFISEPISGNSVDTKVADWMDAIIDEQLDKDIKAENKYSESELKKLQELRDKYKAGDKATIEKIHQYLNEKNSGAEPPKANTESGTTTQKKQTLSHNREGKTEELAPRRRVRNVENLERQPTRLVQSDGTSRILDPTHPTSKLTWKERLTDTELTELENNRKLLEERVKNGERLSAEDSKKLESLRYLEKNKYDPKVHREFIAEINKSSAKTGVTRPEGGFKAGEISGRLTAVAILMTAALGVYINSQKHESATPLRRSSF